MTLFYTRVCTRSLQLCLTLYDPMNWIPPISSVLGVLQERILEWGAEPFSKVCSWPRDWIHLSYIFHIVRQVLYHLHYLGSLYYIHQFSCSVMSNSLWPHGLQQARLSCALPTPGVCSNSCPSSRWCHLTISSSVSPFSCLQSFPASGSFPVSQLFISDDQSIGVSASASVLNPFSRTLPPPPLCNLILISSQYCPQG